MSLLFRSTSLPIVTNWYLRENQRHPDPLSDMSNCAGSQFDHWVGVANSEVTAITIFVTTKCLVLGRRSLQVTCNCTYLRLGIYFEGSKKLKATLKVENNGKTLKLSPFFMGNRYLRRFSGFVPKGVISNPKIDVADFGSFKRFFLSMKLIQKSHFRVQGMFLAPHVL